MNSYVRRLAGATVVVANLALLAAALIHRRSVFEQSVRAASPDVAASYLGLAVNTAVTVVVLGTVLVYALLRGLGRLVDQLVERRGGQRTRLVTRVVDVTTGALQAGALLLPSGSSSGPPPLCRSRCCWRCRC